MGIEGYPAAHYLLRVSPPIMFDRFGVTEGGISDDSDC